MGKGIQDGASIVSKRETATKQGNGWRGCAPPGRKSGFQLAHTLCQQPQGTVQANIGINALHRSGTLAATVGATATQSAFGEVFLYAVKRHPPIGAAVVIAARDRKSVV